MNERDEIRRLMQRIRRTRSLPPSTSIVQETFSRLGYFDGRPADEILNNFNDLLRQVWEETLHTLERYEEQSYARGIPEEFIRSYPEEVASAEQEASENSFSTGVAFLFNAWYTRFRRAFLSVSQGRMARGGKDFELQIKGLLDLAAIPSEEQSGQEHTDLILPNRAMHEQNRTVSIIISVKRTLRERWAEVAEELFNLRSPNVFLFTANESISAEKIDSICRQYNIHLVVWDHVKQEHFLEEPLVLGYTQWATERLNTLRQNW